MQPSDTFRSRRPPSPHGMRQSLTTGLPIPTPRFQQPRYVEEGQPMGADEKLDAVRGGVSPNTASRMFGGSVVGPRTPGGALGKITSGEFKVLIAVVLVACAVRLFRLGKPNSVVFDEVHFGKFAAKYIRVRPIYHPPSTQYLNSLF
jgi:dolichyl-phosphate-mannose-protein mannosyltransferase